MVATSTVTSLAVRTYAWAQALWTIGSCLNSPVQFWSTTDQCISGAYFCDGVPTLPSVSPNGMTYPNSFRYQYTYVRFFGVTKANLTTDRTTLQNLATGLLVAACKANSTCAAAYASNSSSLAAVQNLVATNTGKLINTLPATGQWLPYEGAAFSSVLDPPNMLATSAFGVDDAVLNSVVSGRLNYTRFKNVQRMQTLQSGGFAMMESVLNTIIFASYACRPFYLVPSSASQTRRHLVLDTSEAQNSKRSIAHFGEQQQGFDGTRISSRAVCDSATTVATRAKRYRDTANRCGTKFTSFSVDMLQKTFDSTNISSSTLVSQALGSIVNARQVSLPQYISATLAVSCSKTKLGAGTCYPGAGVFDPKNRDGYFSVAMEALKGTSTAAASGTRARAGQLMGLGLDLTCATLGPVADAFEKGTACCQANCLSPVCVSASDGALASVKNLGC
ncbi:hypothetical protein ACM66B_003332 [Microbotryomycetes sp. NB124-2]